MTREEHAEFVRGWRWILLLLAIFWVTVFSILFPPLTRLVWNASASAPTGLYSVSPTARLSRGAMVVARVPKAFRGLAATRRYLPSNVPLVKRVAGVPGDRICAAGATVSRNGAPLAARLRADAAGRPLPWWQGCRTLTEGEYFLLMADVPGSFDGRYFGVTNASDIIGRASPLWVR